MCSVESSFHFESYKIDEFQLETDDSLSFLFNKKLVSSEDWQFRIGFRRPSYFEKKGVYVVGLSVDMRLTDNSPSTTKNLARIHVAIAGVFRCEKGQLPAATEEKLVKYQAPFILLPYLRGAITSFFANAGYGSIVLPLINMNALAENELGDTSIDYVK